MLFIRTISMQLKSYRVEDMLTLITCHPYTQNYQRYVVYCRRAGNGDEYAQEAEDRNPIMNIEGADYESSEKDIEREQLINRGGNDCFSGGICCFYICVSDRMPEKKEKKEEIIYQIKKTVKYNKRKTSYFLKTGSFSFVHFDN